MSANGDPVAQIGNLPCRRFAIGGHPINVSARGSGRTTQNKILRYSRVQLCATISVGRLRRKEALDHGLANHKRVQRNGPVLQVADIRLDTTSNVGNGMNLAPETVYLGPSGDARLDKFSQWVFFFDFGPN